MRHRGAPAPYSTQSPSRNCHQKCGPSAQIPPETAGDIKSRSPSLQLMLYVQVFVSKGDVRHATYIHRRCATDIHWVEGIRVKGSGIGPSRGSSSLPDQRVIAVGAKVGFKKNGYREEALAELELLARGRHSSQQTVLERYRRCTDWKQASLILCRAMGNGPARRQGPHLTAPPGWLPPLM